MDVVLILGPVSFSAFEVPAGINFGGQQILAVHQLSDGYRVIDNIGPAQAEISFSGIFSGPDATLRARLLNSLRMTGAEISLTWDIFFYTVMLSRFDADYESPVWIRYKISCTILRDEAAAVTFVPPSLSNSLLTDVGTAAALCTGAGIDFSLAQSSVAAPNAGTLGSAAYAVAQAALNAAQSAISTQVNQMETTIDSAFSSDETSANAFAGDVSAAAAAAQRLAVLLNGGVYISRAARNLLNASS